MKNRTGRTAGTVFFIVGLFVFSASVFLSAQPAGLDFFKKADFRGRPALVLSNDVLELTVLPLGGAFARILLKDDPEKNNPLWDSLRADLEAGHPLRNNGTVGHFVCVDGFGPASEEEREAGLPGHGEAQTLPWSTELAVKNGKVLKLVQAVQLPRVQEIFRRTIQLRDGENVIRVQSTLQSLLAFDRPIHWAEHATIGSPFLEPGVTVVDISSNRAMTRPDRKDRSDLVHRFPAGKEFEWPIAPGNKGGTIDLRAAPENHRSLDHTGHLMDENQRLAFVTALHPAKRLLLGYIFKRAEFPWLQTWEFYPPEGMMARGLEFGTQAFDQPRRQVITQNRLLGELLYRWLPARSKIEATYLMFWARTPAGFLGVDDIQVGGDNLKIFDHRSGQTLTLKSSLPL